MDKLDWAQLTFKNSALKARSEMGGQKWEVTGNEKGFQLITSVFTEQIISTCHFST